MNEEEQKAAEAAAAAAAEKKLQNQPIEKPVFRVIENLGATIEADIAITKENISILRSYKELSDDDVLELAKQIKTKISLYTRAEKRKQKK